MVAPVVGRPCMMLTKSSTALEQSAKPLVRSPRSDCVYRPAGTPANSAASPGGKAAALGAAGTAGAGPHDGATGARGADHDRLLPTPPGVELVVMPGTIPLVMVSHACNPCGGFPLKPVNAVRLAISICCSRVASAGFCANCPP